MEISISKGFDWSIMGDIKEYLSNYKYKWRYKDSERPYGCCYDCRLKYSEFKDMIIPDDLWERINPTYHKEAGLLCPDCIINRLSFIKECDNKEELINQGFYKDNK